MSNTRGKKKRIHLNADGVGTLLCSKENIGPVTDVLAKVTCKRCLVKVSVSVAKQVKEMFAELQAVKL